MLGVRDSIQGRLELTAQQRADVRGRIAQRLAQSSGLLVLDNCEHLIGAVADLVAFLISATSGLHVLTTSRAPLGIAAEHVYLLGELETADAAALFTARAVAARPNVRLPAAAVTSIATRLDGLPLAIELAAVQVRAMTVEEIDRRLENRFALLRGGDRSAPDRHQTLLAVIDWSWNLLDASERRALGRLALFNDGFTLEAAETVLGAAAVPAVQGLVGQSLLAVRESALGVRYRMLETVREFGRMQLTDAGEDGAGRAALRRWAVGYARAQNARLTTAEQFAAVDALAEEDTNLADELRSAIADGDPATVVELMAALGMFWMMRGEHVRVLVVTDAVFDAIGDWDPPPELRDAIHSATAIMMANSMVGGSERLDPDAGDAAAAGRRIGRSAAVRAGHRDAGRRPRGPRGLRVPAGAARVRGRPGNRGRRLLLAQQPAGKRRRHPWRDGGRRARAGAFGRRRRAVGLGHAAGDARAAHPAPRRPGRGGRARAGRAAGDAAARRR